MCLDKLFVVAMGDILAFLFPHFHNTPIDCVARTTYTHFSVPLSKYIKFLACCTCPRGSLHSAVTPASGSNQ